MRRTLALWLCLGAAMTVPLALSLTSPFLAFRNPAYIVAGISGILGLSLMLLQPLLRVRLPMGLSARRQLTLHHWIGAAICASVFIHIGGLYLTSPPDTIDALTLAAPTAFSYLGVAAMWGLVLTVLMASIVRRKNAAWRSVHKVVSMIIVGGTVLHAVLIQGTMEPVSKYALCASIVAANLWVMYRLRRPQPA